MLPGGYAPWAEKVSVPTLVAVGDHDLHGAEEAVPSLPNASRVDVYTLPDSWHCHHVANTRERLWNYTADWRTSSWKRRTEPRLRVAITQARRTMANRLFSADSHCVITTDQVKGNLASKYHAAWDAGMAKFDARRDELAGTISYLNYRADLFVVDYFEGRDGVGVYGNAVYIAESVWLLSSSLALAAYARVGGLDGPAAAALTTRIIRHTTAAVGVVCVALFVVAGPLVDLLFGDEFAGMVAPLRILLPGTLVYGAAAGSPASTPTSAGNRGSPPRSRASRSPSTSPSPSRWCRSWASRAPPSPPPSRT